MLDTRTTTGPLFATAKRYRWAADEAQSTGSDDSQTRGGVVLLLSHGVGYRELDNFEFYADDVLFLPPLLQIKSTGSRRWSTFSGFKGASAVPGAYAKPGRSTVRTTATLLCSTSRLFSALPGAYVRGAARKLRIFWFLMYTASHLSVL